MQFWTQDNKWGYSYGPFAYYLEEKTYLLNKEAAVRML